MYEINFDRIADELETVPHGKKTEYKKAVANRYKITIDLLHRRLRKLRGRSKTVVKKSDPRKLEICTMIVEMKERGKMRSEKEHEMSTATCIRRLVKKGLVTENEISPSHANRIIRQELAYREPIARTKIETVCALQEVQIDFSHSKYFKVSHFCKDRGEWIMKASGRALSYKQNPLKFKPILAGLIDHYSRMRLVRAYPGCSESTMIGMSMLQFWLCRDDDEHIMRHLPFTLAHDGGAPWKSSEFKSVVKALELNTRMIPPYEKTSLGMVERYWQQVWKYELEWSEDYPELTLTEYNNLLHSACIHEGSLPHPNMGESRVAAYQKSILRTQPAVLDVDLVEFATRTFIRRVKDLRISIESEEFKIPQYVGNTWTNGKQVRAYRNMQGDWLAELVDEFSKPFRIEPAQATIYGSYSANQETFAKKVVKKIDSGMSMYLNVNKQQDGSLVDMETGEIIDEPKRLMPAKKVASVDSPFGTGKEEFFSSRYEARSYIGAKLEAWSLTYKDVQNLFNPLIEDEQPEKSAIDRLLNSVEQRIRAQTGT